MRLPVTLGQQHFDSLAEELGAEVREASLPRSVDYGMPCYYLVAPAEASSNLARYDGVRYGYRASVDGDLTALYDFNAPWVVPQLRASFKIVIINNGGGRVFDRVASLRKVAPEVRERLIENAHSLSFDAWSKMWGIESSVIEMRPDREATRRVWKRYDALWA